MSFATWNKKFLKNMVCKSKPEVLIWLKKRGIHILPDIISKI